MISRSRKTKSKSKKKSKKSTGYSASISFKRKNPEFSETRKLIEWLDNSKEILQNCLDYLSDYKDSDTGKYYISELNKESKNILRMLKRDIQGYFGMIEYNIPNKGNAGTF